MICDLCGMDINAMGMDNLSPLCGHPICEACIDDYNSNQNYYDDKFEREDYQ